MLTIKAPAKINLTLEVLGKRPDGFHNIRSVIQTIDLCDELTVQPSERVILESDLPEWSVEKSLVLRAVELVHKECRVNRGIDIRVSKRIPLVSGLGGDSSDAAAALKGLNRVWDLKLSKEKLLELAAKLGSDVPFFIDGGTALMEGRGEIVFPLPPLPETWLVLMIPDVPRIVNKTAQLYASLKPDHFTDGLATDTLVSKLSTGERVAPELLFNTFEEAAFERAAELIIFSRHMLKAGATNVHLAGSGPALFSLMPDKAAGEELIERLKGQGMEPFLTCTLNPSEQ